MGVVTDMVQRYLVPQLPDQPPRPGTLWTPPALSVAATSPPPAFSLSTVPSIAQSGPPLGQRPPFPTTWETRAWDYYRHCGEARQAVDWLSSAISRCHLYIGSVPTTPNTDPDPLDNPGVAGEVLAELHDGPVGQAAMLKRLAIHLLVPGATWLAGYPDPTADEKSEKTRWAVLSRKEWQQGTDRVVRLKLPDHPTMAQDGWVELPADKVALVPLYNPDAEDATVATSAFEAALDTLDELKGLSRRVGADIQSRLIGSGVFPIPESATLLQATASEGAALHTDPFVAAFFEAARKAIANPGDPASCIPITFRIPDDMVGKLEHITFTTPFDAQLPVLREAARRTLAADLDIPASVVLGVEDLNHWSAWAVQDDAVRAHIGPLITQICVGITLKILWPALKAAGVADYQKMCVWWDASAITQRPDRSTVVIAAATSTPPIISPKAARRELAFDESDAPAGEGDPPTDEQDQGGEPPGEDGGQTDPGTTPAPPDSPGGEPESSAPPTQNRVLVPA